MWTPTRLGHALRVMSVPTLMIVKGGEVVNSGRFTSNRSSDALETARSLISFVYSS